MTNMTNEQLRLEEEFISNAHSRILANFIGNATRNTEYQTQTGLKAVQGIVEEAKNYLTYLTTAKGQHKNLFWHHYVKPALVNEEVIGKKPVIEELADMIALNIVGALSKRRRMAALTRDMSDAGFNILNVDPTLRKELSDHAMKFFMGVVQQMPENTDVNLYIVEQEDEFSTEKVIKHTGLWTDALQKEAENLKTRVSPAIPMVCFPVDHNSLCDVNGGYLSIKAPLLKKHAYIGGKVHNSIISFNSNNNKEYFELVNKAQRTPFQVNTKLLDIINECHKDGKYFASYPHDFEQMKEFIEEETKKEVEVISKKYKTVFKSELNKIDRKVVSKAKEMVRKTNDIMQMAEVYRSYNNIYYPLYLDSRGRVLTYVHTGSLTYMGGELAKGLLVLSNKEKFNEEGISQLFQTLANALDHNKKGLKKKERIAREWYNDNAEDFRAGNFDIFFQHDNGMDEPINGLAIVLELLEWEKDENYESGYIAHRDARCSGLSIIGTITGDAQAMKLTSVIDTVPCGEQDLPDAYSAVAAKGRELNTVPYFEANADVLFGRKVWKTPVMTRQNYGASRFTINEHNVAAFNEKELDVRRVGHFTKLMMETLDASLPCGSVYLNAITNAWADYAKNKDNDCVAFKVPFTGFPVVRRKQKVDEQGIIESPGSFKRIQLVIKKYKKEMDISKMRAAAGADTIHSLDASLLFRVRAIIDFDIATVHDSIGAHPNNVSKVVKAYGQAMYDLNAEQVLSNIFQQLGAVAPVINTATAEEVEGIKNSIHILV